MAAAERAQGKRGNEVQAEVDRYFWQHPRCKAVETLCDPTCMGDFTEDTGSITVGPGDYKSMKNCLWNIKVDPTKAIQLQFNKSHGFGVEYHRNCAYDKIHIFDNLDNSRLARMCGPKEGGTPFDGSQKLKPINGVMEMWDVPYDSHSNQVMIAFDTDRDSDGFAGFELSWTSNTVYTADFTNMEQSLNWLREKLTAIANRREFKGHGRTIIKNRIDGYVDAGVAAVNRVRACSREASDPLSNELFAKLKDLNDGKRNAYFMGLADTAREIIMFYLESCYKAEITWIRNTQNLKNKFSDNLLET